MGFETTVDAGPLRAACSGVVIAAGDPGWDEARQAFNLAVDQRPALVVAAHDARDVAAAIAFAAERGLAVAPQASGHNAIPLGDLSGTLLLKTGAMARFSVDAATRTARAEAGAKWGPICDAASGHGLAPLSGSARDVGVVGYSLGGGVGWLARKHGMQANAVTAIELVTAAGTALRVDADTEPELFWALRGGGGGFGVVTAIEFELIPVEEIYAGAVFFGFERADEIVHAWREWCGAVPDELTSTAKLLQLPPLPEIPEPLRGGSFAVVQAAFLGSELEGQALLDPLRALGPSIDTFAMVEPAALSFLAMDPEDPMPYLSSSQLVERLPAAAVDAFLAATGPGSGSTLAAAELRHLGGALARTGSHHGARDTLAGSNLAFAVAPLIDPAQAPAIEEQLRRFDAALAPYDGGSYPNFAEKPVDPARLFDAATLARLRAVKERWDPRGVIHANHALG